MTEERRQSSTDTKIHEREGTTVEKLFDLIWQKFQMKWLSPLLEDVFTRLVRFIDSRPEMTEKGTKPTSWQQDSLWTMASCAFGLERKCFEKENSHTGNFRDFRTGIQSHTQVLLREELVGAFEENGEDHLTRSCKIFLT